MPAGFDMDHVVQSPFVPNGGGDTELPQSPGHRSVFRKFSQSPGQPGDQVKIISGNPVLPVIFTNGTSKHAIR